MTWNYSKIDVPDLFTNHKFSIPSFLLRSETFQETVSERQMKLEAVRSLFHNVYAGAVGYGNKQDQNTGLSGILDQVTSKMIKATWITSVWIGNYVKYMYKDIIDTKSL